MPKNKDLAILLNLSLALSVFSMPYASAQSTSDQETIKAQAVDYGKAFARGDADALAAMWAEDGTFTDDSGQVYKGRAAIAKYFHDQFNGGGAADLDITIDSLNLPADGVAIEEGSTRVTSGQDTGARGRYLVVHTKKNGTWLMQSAIETACPPDKPVNNLADLDWLVGNWTCHGARDNLHMRAEWSKSKSFLVCRFFSGEVPAGQPLFPKVEAIEVLGFDPVIGRIRTWHFDEGGGFGGGRMRAVTEGPSAGKSWQELAQGLQPDGTGDGGLNTYTKVDDNTFTWQSTRRHSAGKPMPDTTLLTLTRDHD